MCDYSGVSGVLRWVSEGLICCYESSYEPLIRTLHEGLIFEGSRAVLIRFNNKAQLLSWSRFRS